MLRNHAPSVIPLLTQDNLVIPEEYADIERGGTQLFISVGVSNTLTSVSTCGHKVESGGRNLPGIRWGQSLELRVEPHTYPLRRVTLSVFARFAGIDDNYNKSIGHCSLDVNEQHMEHPSTFSSSLRHKGYNAGFLQIQAYFVFTKEGRRFLADLERGCKANVYRPFASIKSLSGAADSDAPTLRNLKSAGSSRSARSTKSSSPGKKTKLKGFLSLFKSKEDEDVEKIVPPAVLQAEKRKGKSRETATKRGDTKSSSKRPQSTRLSTQGTTIRTTNSRSKIEPSRLNHKFKTQTGNHRDTSGGESTNPSHFRQFSSSSSIYPQPPSASFSPYTQQALSQARETEMALKDRRVSRSNPQEMKSRGTDYSAEVETFSQMGTDDNQVMSPDLGSKLASPLSSRLVSEARSYNEQVQPLIVRKSRGGGASSSAAAVVVAPSNTAGSYYHKRKLCGSGYETGGPVGRGSMPPSRNSDRNSLVGSGVGHEYAAHHSPGGQYYQPSTQMHSGQYQHPHHQQWSQSRLLRNEWQDENQNGISCQFCGRFNPL
ncbi:hypothetical protein B0I71DRAFT_134486 [Yarrowia lipolytica]|uniref:Uncharacterized protein n=1 Tax=Yarrowia lipolytica TaxID=4952 RepID=A0A371C1Z8_YARLL|nr:hypothetical protein B0I71DRAFT_134486 [Yarrowia lipolytica]